VPNGGRGPMPVDDESVAEIDQYMEALLARVKQQSTAVEGHLPGDDHGEAPRPSGTAAVSVPAGEAIVVPANESRPEFPVDDGGGPVAEPSVPCPTPIAGAGCAEPTAAVEEAWPVRSTRPPEQFFDLSAMRQLANHSAQDAIATHRRAEMLSRAYAKLAIAILATIASVLLFWMSPAGHSFTLMSAFVALLVAIVWGFHHLILGWRAWFGYPRRPPTSKG